MTLGALLFDVDGTLADTEEAHRQAFNATFEHAGLPFVWSRAEYRALLEVTGGKERLAHYFKSRDLPPAERSRLSGLVPSLHQEKNARFAELVRQGKAPLRPGVARLLDEADRAGVRLGIASTTSRENVVALLRAELGPASVERFAVIACGDAVPAKKPAPDVYELALSTLGLGPARAVAFEDSASGLAAAKAAGLFTVVTRNQWTEGQDLDAADLLLPNLGDPTQPLDDDAATVVGGPFLTLERLESLLERGLMRPRPLR